MALAPFFGKTALAASSVLQGFDRAAFESLLNRHVVALAFDDEAVASDEGWTAIELSVNLLARLYPRLAIVPLGTGAERRMPALETLAQSINPRMDRESATSATLCLCVGRTAPKLAVPTIYIGSDGAVAKLSTRVPQPIGHSRNPFGAAAAACLGNANIFRAVAAAQLPHGALDGDLHLSVFDLIPNAPEPVNPPLDAPSLGEAHLVGAGAIGNAALWTLARVPFSSGLLHVVDGESVELSNVQRYVLATAADVESQKVDLAAQAFTRSVADAGFRVEAHAVRWGGYLAGLPTPWQLRRVAVALDSAFDRCSVQASLPQWIANAWTQPGDLGISAHDIAANEPCLACLYLPDGPAPNEDHLVAEAIGLPGAEDRMEIRTLLVNGAAVGEPFVERIASALNIPVDALREYADRSLRDFYREVACGGVLLRLSPTGGTRGVTEVPMAFQSALAGVLLAAKLVADANGVIATPRAAKAVIDVLRPVPAGLWVPISPRADGRCLCQDPDYRDAFEAKYRD